jgi:hypothetical protein
MKEIDLSGFHFHLFPDRSYVIVAPESDDEDRRLNVLVDATAICREVFKAHLSRAKPNVIGILIEPRQVGCTPQNEAVLVVVEGSYMLRSEGKPRINGRWSVARVPANGFEELKTDLRAAMEHHRHQLSSSLPASEFAVGTVETIRKP